MRVPTAFSGYHDLHLATRLKLGEDSRIRPDGRQKELNIFARAWDCLTRSPEKIESNKSVTRAFVKGLEKEYGKDVANMASRELQTHLDKGRPLTAYRVHRTLVKATRMEARITSANHTLLNRHAPEILTKALTRSFGSDNMPSSSVIDPGELLEIVDRALTHNQAFTGTKYDGDSAKFVRDMTEVATRAIDRAVQTKLLPNAMAIVNRDGDPKAKVTDELQMNQLMRLDLPETESLTFTMVATFLDGITSQLSRPDVEDLDPHTATVFLGQIAYLREQLAPPQEGGERLIDLDLQGPAAEYRDALLQDMQGLLDHVETLTGFKTLPKEAQDAMLTGLSTSGALKAEMEEGKWGHVAAGMDRSLEELTALQQQLSNIDRDGMSPTLSGLVDVVKSRCEETLESLHGLQVDMQQMGDAGFDPQDAVRLREQGKDVGGSLAKFSQAERTLLQESGHGIELGLQYKEREIPIHERTMVGEFTGENIVGDPKKLTGGMCSNPYKATWHLSEDRKVIGVFKEAKPKEGYGPPCEKMGIDPSDSRMAVRSIATGVVDELLDFGIVPETRFGTMNGKLGVIVDFAPGVSPSKKVDVDLTDTDEGQSLLPMMQNDPEYAKDMEEVGLRVVNGRLMKEQVYGIEDFNLDDPGLRRDLVKLQLLDALCGQGDRHGQNYIIKLDSEGRYAGLLAIDNDQAFGPNVRDPNELLNREMGREQLRVGDKSYGAREFRGVLLPEVIDVDMAESINKLTPEGLRSSLTGLLKEDEIQAAVDRLQVLKDHVEKLEKSGQVIGIDEWGSETATNSLQNVDTSYVARERDNQKILPGLRYEEAL